MQEARFAGACQDQRAARPKGNQSVQQAEASVVSQKSLGGGAPGPQGLGAQGDPKLSPTVFRRSQKSPEAGEGVGDN